MIDHESKLSYSHIVYQNVSRRVLQMEPMGGQIFETKIKPSPDLTRHTERHTLFIYLEVGVGVRCVCVWKDRSRFHCDPVSTKLIPS
jgi:hypothetical protein